MHSRIFQIERNPVCEDDYLCKELIPDWFTHSVADYMVDVGRSDRNGEIDWLMNTDFGKVCVRDGEKITFNIYTDSFFEECFNQFKKVLEDLSEVTLEQFAGERKQDTPYNKQLDHLMFLLSYGGLPGHCETAPDQQTGLV